MRQAVIFLFLLFSMHGNAQTKTVTIGSQVWMAKNLESSNFQNNTPIIHAQSLEAWQQATENAQPAWCWYYDETTGRQYGHLYNIHAMTKGNPCPQGFRLPTKDDWETLFSHVANDPKALKSLEGWSDGSSTNSSGFNALPGGVKSGYGGFNDYKKAAYFWSSTAHPDAAYGLYSVPIEWHASKLALAPSGKKGGLNCRCIKE